MSDCGAQPGMHDRVQVAHCPGRQSPSLVVGAAGLRLVLGDAAFTGLPTPWLRPLFPRSVVGSCVGGLCVSIAGRAPGRFGRQRHTGFA